MFYTSGIGEVKKKKKTTIKISTFDKGIDVITEV